jgi:hypothetical protein
VIGWFGWSSFFNSRLNKSKSCRFCLLAHLPNSQRHLTFVPYIPLIPCTAHPIFYPPLRMNANFRNIQKLWEYSKIISLNFGKN